MAQVSSPSHTNYKPGSEVSLNYLSLTEQLQDHTLLTVPLLDQRLGA